MVKLGVDEAEVVVSSSRISVELATRVVEVLSVRPVIIKSRPASIQEVKALKVSLAVVIEVDSTNSGLEKMLPISLPVSLSLGVVQRTFGIVDNHALVKGVLFSIIRGVGNLVSVDVPVRERNLHSGLTISNYVQV